jgi:hypothetical protein
MKFPTKILFVSCLCVCLHISTSEQISRVYEIEKGGHSTDDGELDAKNPGNISGDMVNIVTLNIITNL